MDNSNNKSSKIELNPVLQEISKILNFTPEQVAELKIKQEKKGLQDVISSLLSGNEKKIGSDIKAAILLLKYYKKDITDILDGKVKNNRQVILLSLKKDYRNFYNLDDEFKKDPSLGKAALDSMISQSVGVEQVVDFINNFFTDPKLNEALKDYYLEKLKRANKIYNDDLSKGILLIMKDGTNFYKLLLERNILKDSSRTFRLDGTFTKTFFNLISQNRELDLLTDEELISKKKEILLNLLGVSLSSLSSDDLFVFNTIFNLLNVGENIKKGKSENEKNKDKDKNKNGKKIEDDLQDEDISPEEKMDFCLPGYEFQEVSSGHYSITTGVNKDIKISKQELDNFTTTGLKNFIKFYEMLCDLSLNFLWDKNKSSFINILNNKIGFNYPDGEGVTESRALRVLNLLGHAIGLIGNDKESNHKKSFDTLAGVRLAFQEVKSTGNIGGNSYEVGSMTSASPFESALKYRGYMSEKNELNFSKF